MTRTAGAQIGCQRPSRFWGLGCPKIYHEAEDTLVFVFQLCLELMPASIQNGLRHFGLDQLGTTHIAHEDDAIAFRQVRREFMCCIFASVPWAGPHRDAETLCR
ncbi:hypothetical protein [Thiolapillus sp.]|uniref:hypothetical protein n=1 Tax=Thiolapillus sp. TaxID=2017437 RepID=UPI003AF84F9F